MPVTRRRKPNLSGRARKAIASTLTGFAIWVATYVSAKWGALDAVLTAGLVAYLVPNDKDPDAKPWEPPVRDAGQAGVLTVIAMALLCIALLVWLSQHTTITTH